MTGRCAITNDSTGEVVQVLMCPASDIPYKIGFTARDVLDDVSLEHTWDGSTFVPPQITYTPTVDDVNAERDRRIDGGFNVDFGGEIGIKPFDSDQEARDNIAGAHSFALSAIVAGAQPGNLRWADPNNDFEWICADNTKVAMDAITTLKFAAAAMGYKSAIITTARAIKDTDPIPENYDADELWPSKTLTLT